MANNDSARNDDFEKLLMYYRMSMGVLSDQKLLKGVPIVTSDNVYIYLNNAIAIINAHWDEILDKASEEMFKHISSMKYEDRSEMAKQFHDSKTLRQYIKLLGVEYDDEEMMTYNKNVCGTTRLSLDTTPFLDPNRIFTVTVDCKSGDEIQIECEYK